ncbi:MAG: hypothetical protein Q9163_003454 [Psora crenata]
MDAVRASNRKHLCLKPKPRIEVKLHGNQQDVFTPCFTSLDEIKGEVSVTSQTDVQFQDIYITFEGSTRTYVEKMAITSPRTEAFQTFLRLVQPIDPSAFATPRVFESCKTYKFPFNFVVPERLLPQSCIHDKDEYFPEDVHLNLPPSFGDPMVSALGKFLRDDVCPDMATITYSINCRLTSGRNANGKHIIIAQGSKKLRIAPALEEAPPVNAEGGEKDDYRLREEKSIRRGTFRKELGRLTAEAAQPRSLHLPSIHSDSTCPVTTMATVRLRFDPSDDNAQPPKLDKLVAKLHVATFFATVPLRALPRKTCDFHYSNVKDNYFENIPLSSRCLANVQWEQHAPESESGREPRISMRSASDDIPWPSSGYKGRAFFIAKVVVPISLPSSKNILVPSFHSCLVSRVYTLELYLNIQTPKATAIDPQLHLRLPIQVSCETNPRPAVANTPSREAYAAMAARGANVFFTPRTIGLSSDQYISQANLSRSSTSTHTTIIATSAATTSNASSPGVGQALHEASPRAQNSPTLPSNADGACTNPPVQAISFAEEVPPAPGPGWIHRSSWASGVIPERPPLNVRMLEVAQRFQSLSFDHEDMAAVEDQAQGAPPPAYSILVGLYNGRSSINALPRRNTGGGI